MIRVVRAFALATLTVLSVLSLDGQLAGARADEFADCSTIGDAQIRDCSRIIKSGRLFGKPISKAYLAIVYINRGGAYDYKGEYDRAIADFDKAIELNPKDGGAYINRGAVNYHKGEYDRAIADYTQAIKLDPKDAAVYTNRGIAYRRQGDFDRAIADYDKAIELNPKYANAYNGRAWAYYK